ncbi:hypothetical protein M758_1G143800 [Ceratodon purpureus]|uniref:UDP-glycosyltransferases domain-containing protein n=1 Tax=Ceratodon purpureus TaxID=3225 RepID=A0A8T0J6B3_CERPU|nr:hypothetical protein KC19_1G147400 [Ceratodon purpureus]KAG0629976.1 hypothetical protein M758_1G143800 [Ceratodon purpureus]
MGLENSSQPFLWILRPSDSLPAGFEDRVKGRGMCYSGWVPQTSILTHPATGGFLSHCGWNSTLESVSAGVPILGWSRGADQHLICRFLVDTARVAMELQKDPPSENDVDNMVVNPMRHVTREEIAVKVRKLMREEEGSAVRARMASMRDAAAEATAAGGSSRRSLDAYVQLLRLRCRRNSTAFDQHER